MFISLICISQEVINFQEVNAKVMFEESWLDSYTRLYYDESLYLLRCFFLIPKTNDSWNCQILSKVAIGCSEHHLHSIFKIYLLSSRTPKNFLSCNHSVYHDILQMADSKLLNTEKNPFFQAFMYTQSCSSRVNIQRKVFSDCS